MNPELLDDQQVSARKYKRTKIIATIGPATASQKAVDDMIASGVNGFRLNFSHGTHEQHAQFIKWIRKGAEKAKKPVAIIQDLQGPRIRVGKLKKAIELKKGNTIKIAYGADYEKTGIIPIQHDLSEVVKPGEPVFMVDGRIRGQIEKVEGKIIFIKIHNGGELKSNKGVNLPDTDLGGDILTAKDHQDIKFGVEHDVDYIALSFVQTSDDVEQLREHLDNLNSDVKIISKIETKKAVENLQEIILTSDGAMVARGDLAIEVSPEAVPIIQRKIVEICLRYGKVVIIATQMLASMTENPQPTRAEASDVSTAVIIGADAVMLSDETASGDYPIEAIKMMKRIILYSEENSPVKPLYMNADDHSTQSAISSAVITLAHQVGATAIVAETSSGQTARSIASHRPSMPIFMVTHNQRVAQQLAIVYSSKAYYWKKPRGAGKRLTDWLASETILKKGDIIVRASGRHPGVSGGTDTIKVRIIE